MRVLLVRHGETVWNAENRVQGQSDIPLNDMGRAQAAKVAARLARETFEVAYTSDLQRAWDTAAAIIAHHPGVEVRSDPRLRETSKGVWEGRRWAEIHAEHAGALIAWHENRDQIPAGGETLSDLAARVSAVLADLKEHHMGQSVLVVGHGVVLRVLVCLALEISPARAWNIHMGNAALSEIRFDSEGALLVRLNDVSHLG
jgi:probable phosphoglycerate mutase